MGGGGRLGGEKGGAESWGGGVVGHPFSVCLGPCRFWCCVGWMITVVYSYFSDVFLSCVRVFLCDPGGVVFLAWTAVVVVFE